MSPGPILNGKDKPFGQSTAGLPDVSSAIIDKFQPVTIGIVKSTQVNGRTQSIVEEYINTRGARVETPNTLTFSKNGERFWLCTDIYFLNDVILKPDDLFLFNKVQYRVIASEEWTEYGFNRYHVIQDFSKLYQPRPTEV